MAKVRPLPRPRLRLSSATLPQASWYFVNARLAIRSNLVSLAGLIGKKASGVPNYNYSPAMKGSSLTWDVATLDAYLSDPQRLVPGNKMPFPGLKTENERNAVIAFLASTSVPGPAAPAAAAARAPAAAAA
ncbi:MAG: hypothetical protein WCD87_25815, partial [Pseudolabrys sp.]